MCTETATPLLHCTGFLRLAQVLELIPMSRASWYNGVRSGKFPSPVRLSERMSVYRVEDIIELIAKLGKRE